MDFVNNHSGYPVSPIKKTKQGLVNLYKFIKIYFRNKFRHACTHMWYSLQQYFTQQGNYILSIQFYVTNCRFIIICRGSPLTEFLESPRPQIYILKKLNLKIIAIYLLKLKSDASTDLQHYKLKKKLQSTKRCPNNF